MSRSIVLGEQSVQVHAAAELCFQVVASAGSTIEDRGDREKLVRFRTQLGNRELVTVEVVRLKPPNRISYRWVEGPLRNVQESIDILPISEEECELRHGGHFDTRHGGVRGLVEGWIIGRMFDRAVREHLEQAKLAAAARAERSHMFPRKTP